VLLPSTTSGTVSNSQIGDLREGADFVNVPSGNFFANAAWLVRAALAHDLIRWTAILGDITPSEHFTWYAPCAHGSSRPRAAWSADRASPLCVHHSSGPGRNPKLHALTLV
jgi:hypothetical protein